MLQLASRPPLRRSSLLVFAFLPLACAAGTGGSNGPRGTGGNGGTVGTGPGGGSGGSIGGAGAGGFAGRNGFPGDFPQIMDAGGSGRGEMIQGFGGDTTTDRAGNRAQLRHRPVLLLHGNGVNATDPRFGMRDMHDMLIRAGYVDAEIWAPSYLGQSISSAEIPTPQRNNIDDVRHFADALLDYLGAPRIDAITHSLGCNMINDYLRGLQANGTFDAGQGRFDRLGTVVCLGGPLYGTGSGLLYDPEFNLGGAWVEQSITLGGVEDATPYGAAATAQMVGPPTGGTLPGSRPFHATTALDGGARRIYWVALWAIGDIVDANLTNACGLGGADLNQGFDLPDTLSGVLTPQLARHGQLVHSHDVFAALWPFLDR